MFVSMNVKYWSETANVNRRLRLALRSRSILVVGDGVVIDREELIVICMVETLAE